MSDDDHDHGCICEMCSGRHTLDSLEAKEIEMTKKYGFFCHFVFDNDCRYANFHTHGFRKTWGHDDFQIVALLPPNVANNLFWNFANRVKAGEHFADGGRVDKIVNNYDVLLKKAREGGRDVLRIIIPDKNGLFPEDPGVDRYYGMQETVELIEPKLFGNNNVGEDN